MDNFYPPRLSLWEVKRIHQSLWSEDYMMPPSWPFVLVFVVAASALLVVGNFIFPGPDALLTSGHSDPGGLFVGV